MSLSKKKIIQIFSDGSINKTTKTLLKKENKIKIFTKDYLTMSFNKKDMSSNIIENFNTFKNKYIKFK